MKRLLPLLYLLSVSLAIPGETLADPKSADPSPAQAGSATPDPWAKKVKNGVIELEWDDLVPADFTPEKLLERFNVTTLDDSDPRAKEIYRKIQEAWNHAPVVESLNGRRIRLPGFVIPLEGDGKKVSEFILVPYFGACIHVPPPPSNQIVYVKADRLEAKVRNLFDTVWVVGRLSAEYRASDVGNASYELEAESVEPYTENQ
jgi:hypothetical protein